MHGVWASYIFCVGEAVGWGGVGGGGVQVLMQLKTWQTTTSQTSSIECTPHVQQKQQVTDGLTITWAFLLIKKVLFTTVSTSYHNPTPTSYLKLHFLKRNSLFSTHKALQKKNY